MTIKAKLADITPGSQPSPLTAFKNVHDDLESPIVHASLSDAHSLISLVPGQHSHFPAQSPIPNSAPKLALNAHARIHTHAHSPRNS